MGIGLTQLFGTPCKLGKTNFPSFQSGQAIFCFMCKWTRTFWGTDCWRPKNLSSTEAASRCSAGIERARNCLQGEHFARCCHSAHGLLFKGSLEVARGSAAVCDPNPPRPLARYRLFSDEPKFQNFRRHTAGKAPIWKHSWHFLGRACCLANDQSRNHTLGFTPRGSAPRASYDNTFLPLFDAGIFPV